MRARILKVVPTLMCGPADEHRGKPDLRIDAWRVTLPGESIEKVGGDGGPGSEKGDPQTAKDGEPRLR